MIFFPPAKINLGLNVLKKRDDGYHEIKSCMAEIPLCDILEIVPAETFRFVQSGIKIEGNQEDNLCVKAYRLMQEQFDLPPVYIHLRKEIPMGAGLGGGSSDATWVIKGLNAMFRLELDDFKMEELAAKLGSDCAFFVKGGIQMSEGRGEILNPVNADFKGLYLKLIYPGVHIGTAEAYSNVTFDVDVTGYDNIPSRDFNGLRNSFEAHAFAKFPEIAGLRNDLIQEGAVYAAMSGSGSSVFGIFKERPELSGHKYEWILEL